jgi:hypothetical protein
MAHQGFDSLIFHFYMFSHVSLVTGNHGNTAFFFYIAGKRFLFNILETKSIQQCDLNWRAYCNFWPTFWIFRAYFCDRLITHYSSCYKIYLQCCPFWISVTQNGVDKYRLSCYLMWYLCHICRSYYIISFCLSTCAETFG